jgi:DNA polymerase zeta
VTEHFFLPTSSGSEEKIDTSDTAVKFPHTHEIENIDSSVAHSLLEVDERTEAVTKAWFDDGERRPMKRLKIAKELNSQNLTPRHGLFPSTSIKNEIFFGTQGPRAFSTQAKKEIKNAFVYAIIPPPASELLSSLESRGLPSKIYQDPHYSRARDVPERPWEFAGLLYRLEKGDGLSALEEWEPSSTTTPLVKDASTEDRNMFQDRFDRTGVGGWEYASTPPSVREVRRWLTSTTQARVREKPQARSQASGDDCSAICDPAD